MLKAGGAVWLLAVAALLPLSSPFSLGFSTMPRLRQGQANSARLGGLSTAVAPVQAGSRTLLGARLRPGHQAGIISVRCSDSEAWRAEEKVVVVGAGVAGMSCAIQLAEKGIPVVVMEASDGVGGRVRTDNVDGFLLDRGFQIFLTSYPESQRLLDYNQLKLQPFYPGGLVRWNGAFHKIADPFRRPVDAVLSLSPLHPIGSILDKVLVGVLRLQSLIGPLDELWLRPDTTIEERLSYDVLFGTAFSKEMIDRFFRPFLGGIFFDNKLRTTARELDFVFRMLALGDNCLPEKGLGAVSDYMASLLPKDSIRLNSPVKAVAKDGSSVTLASGETIKASAVVVATEGDAARRLLSTAEANIASEGESKKTTCLYFSMDGRPPIDEPILYLNGDGVLDAENTCKINNMCFPNMVAPSYAPAGKSLASVSLIGIPPESDEQVAVKVKAQLKDWFGDSVDAWKLLKTYRIEYCQPNQEPPTNRDEVQQVKDYIFVTGDHTDSASLNGALRSGTRCAQKVADQVLPLLLKRNQGVLDKYAKEKGIDSIKP